MGVIDDGDLLIEIGSQKGGTKGQLILSDVTLSGERDNTYVYGIANNQAEDLIEGNETFTISTEQYINQEAANLLESAYNDDASLSGKFQGGDVIEVSYTKLDWNTFEINGSEDGEVTLTLDADLRGVSITTDV